jgi:hypothetical protein
MQLNEFKAWFEGYTEDIAGAPTEKQFARIKAQVARIDGVPITTTVFRDRYWPVIERWKPYWYATTGQPNAIVASMSADTAAYRAHADAPMPADAMFAVGKADAFNDAQA